MTDQPSAAMSVTLVSHASVVIDTGSVRIWTDPWLFGKAFNDSWSLLVPAAWSDDCHETIDYLWISHEHADHFHVPTLRSMPRDLKERVTVLFREGDAEKMISAFRDLGFARVETIPHRGRISLPGGAEAYSYEVGQMDSCLGVIRGHDVLLNVNDAELSDVDCRLIRSDLGPCHTVLNQFSIAGYGGDPDQATRLTNQATGVLASVVHDHVALGAEVTIPFASFMYFSVEDNRFMNDHVNRPRDVEAALRARGLRSVVLAPGDTYVAGSDHDSAAALDHYDRVYDGLPLLAYDPVESVPLGEVEAAFRSRRAELREIFPALVLRGLGAITASIPDLGVVVRFSFFRGSFERIGDTAEPDIVVNSQPLAFAFRYPYGVQTLGVSARVTVRQGDRRWLRHRMAFALANTGLSLKLRRLAGRSNRRLVRPRLRGGFGQFRHFLRRTLPGGSR